MTVQRIVEVPVASRSLNAVSAQEALVDSLRGRILAGEFAPGTAVSDERLAEEYGVARPTVRAAVQVLVHEDLMRREPRRRGTPVRSTISASCAIMAWTITGMPSRETGNRQ